MTGNGVSNGPPETDFGILPELAGFHLRRAQVASREMGFAAVDSGLDRFCRHRTVQFGADQLSVIAETGEPSRADGIQVFEREVDQFRGL